MQNIINELYKTNLKFRILNNNTIQILNNNMQPIATLSPIILNNNPEPMPYLNPKISDSLKEKGDID